MSYRFLSDGEKERHFFGGSTVDRWEYPARVKVKVYENFELLIYNFTDQLNIVGMFKAVAFSINDQGLCATFINKMNFNLIDIGVTPKRLPGYDIICNLPARNSFERTVKVKEDDQVPPIYGNSTLMNIRFRSHPDKKIVTHDYSVPVYQAGKVLGGDEVRKAYRRLEDASWQ